MMSRRRRSCRSRFRVKQLEQLEPRQLLAVDVTSDLVAHWRFEDVSAGVAPDSAPAGDVVDDGVLQGNAVIDNSAGLGGGALALDGAGDYVAVPSSNDINTRLTPQRTISLWFLVNDAADRQVLFEEGGGGAGLNIYVEQGQLHIGGWNRPASQSNWQETWIATPVSAGQWHHASLVLDGTATVQPNALIGYLDGVEFGRGEGSQVWSHGNPIGLGGQNSHARFDGDFSNVDGANTLDGAIDEVMVFNRALDADDVAFLAQALGSVDITTDLVAHWKFEDAVDGVVPDNAPAGDVADDGVLQGNAFIDTNVGLGGGALALDGTTDYLAVPSSSDINQSIVTQRSIGLWFLVNETNSRQILFEEGGATKGLNIYVKVGTLFVGGWNTRVDQSDWQGTWLSTPVTPGEWHHVTLVLDGTETLQPDALIGYLDGVEFGRGAGSQLWGHGDAIGIGAQNGQVRFRGSVSNNVGSSSVNGYLDDVRVYNRVLTEVEIAQLVEDSPAAPSNSSPDARNDSFSVAEDGSLPGNVLDDNGQGVDSDPDGDSLSVATTPVSGPAHGIVSLASDGNFTYTPAGDYSGNDSFVYRLEDGQGGFDTGTVSITVSPLPDPPTARDDAFSFDEDAVLNGNVLVDNGSGADFDPDNDDLLVETTPVSGPGHGDLTLAANGNFTYTPDEDFFGGDSFVYRIGDGQGGFDEATVNITVVSVNDDPLAKNDTFQMDEDDSLAGNVLSNNGQGADSDPENDSLSIATTAVSGPSHGTLLLSSGGDFTYTPQANFYGDDSFVYQLQDGNGGLDTATVNVTVDPAPDPPVARADAVSTDEDVPLDGNVLADNGSGVDFDPDDDELTVDTTPVSGPSNGGVVLAANGDFTYTPNDDYHGADAFVYRVGDGNGNFENATVSISINPINDPPTAVDDAFSMNEDAVLNGNVLNDNSNGVDFDVDGDSLSVAGAPLSGPTDGALTLNTNGTFTYTPSANFNGVDSFVYRLNDGFGGFHTATVNITVASVPDPPVARDDAVSTDEDVELTGNVLADNGSGVDFDPDGDELTVETTAVSGPSHGNVTLAENGDFTYTPDGDYHGPDAFVYRVGDGNGNVRTATVSITVGPINDPPTAVDDDFSMNENEVLNGNVLSDNTNGVDFDVDGDALSIAGTPISGPSHGALTLNEDGTFTYTPDANFHDVDSFVYRLRDGMGGFNTATVNITVQEVPEPPVARDDQFSTDEDVPVNGNVLLNNGQGVDFDPDGDELTVTTPAVSGPDHGSLTLNSDGTFTYTPNENFHGNDSFDYQIGDGNGGFDTATVSITINPVVDPPVAQDDDFSVDEDQPLSGNVLNDNGHGADSDGDGDALSVVTPPLSEPTNGIVVLNSDGTFDYTPNENFFGADAFEYRVNDGNGGFDRATVNITVNSVNDEPLARRDYVWTVEDTPLLGNVLLDNGRGPDEDPENDPLIVTTTPVSDPTDGTVVLQANGDFTYTPDSGFHGIDTFIYQLGDGNGGFENALVTIAVVPASGDVRLEVGMILDDVVSYYPEGTSFLIAAGVHVQQRIDPKHGMTFTGEPGAILDGENVALYAITSSADNVTIRDLTVVNYATPDFLGAITAMDLQTKEMGDGWLLDGLTVNNNLSAGINLGDNTTVINSFIRDNGLVGIGGRDFTGGLVEGNTITGNNPRELYPGSHGGGVKTAHAANLVVRNNYVENNSFAGIWCDDACTNWTVEGNTIIGSHGRPGTGVHFEISAGAVIRNNTISDVGRPSPVWAWGAGIQISTSSDVLVEGNTIMDADTGVGVVQQARSSQEVENILVDNITIINNVMWESDQAQNRLTGAVTDTGDNSIFSRNFVWQGNTYRGARPPKFWWNGTTIQSLAQWKGLGFDTTGQYLP